MIGSQLRAAGFALALVLWLAACSRPAGVAPAAGKAQPTPDPWPQFASRFLEAYFRAEPKFAVEAGRHEFDGQMPDWSADGIAAQVALLKRLRAEAAAFSDAQLTAAGALRARASVYGDRQRAVLAGARALSLHQSGLVHRTGWIRTCT